MFFFQQNSRKAFFLLRVVNDNEIVRNTSDGLGGKSGLICMVHYIRSCWCRRVLQFLHTLENEQKQDGVGWPPKTMRNSSMVDHHQLLSFIVVWCTICTNKSRVTVVELRRPPILSLSLSLSLSLFLSLSHTRHFPSYFSSFFSVLALGPTVILRLYSCLDLGPETGRLQHA